MPISQVYVREGVAGTTPLKRVRCINEDKELQQLLFENPDLLPGEQIDPDAPRHWIIIKREMPVTDPATGGDRWSIDLFFADQFGIPTLIECKRFNDTRARREVVAQMLEYAANGHHYWSAAEMQKHAEEVAGGPDALTRTLRLLTQRSDYEAEEFFKLVEANLRDAKMRLVFFLEDSSNELRSLVDFLNGQLKETEVLLVEARQYDDRDRRIVVPWLFGFTEKARVAKRESRAESIRAAGERGQDAFWTAVGAGSLSDEARGEMRQLVDDWSEGSLSDRSAVNYGATAIFTLPSLASRGLFALNRAGSLEMYFGYWDEEKYKDVGERQRLVREAFIETIEQTLDMPFSDKQRRGFPQIPAEKWVPHSRQLRERLKRMLDQHVPSAPTVTRGERVI